MFRLASLFAVAGLTLAAMTLVSSPKTISRRTRRKNLATSRPVPRSVPKQVLEPVLSFHARFSLN
jgi:hypothetical protein